MNPRSTILAWAEQGAVTDVPAALGVAGVLPGARAWRAFLDVMLLWSSALAFGAAAVFFIAYNWNDLGKFAKFGLIEVPLALAVVGYWWLGPARAAGQASLLVAALLLGALLALFGQTYQTGADTWELFAAWAALLVPWVLVARMAGLWMLWIAIVNVAIVLYFRVSPGLLGMPFSIEPQLWTLFAFNTVALGAWELGARWAAWLQERLAPRLLVTASCITVTLPMLQVIWNSKEASGLALLVYPLWLAGAYGAYRRLMLDLYALAVGCLSVIVVMTAVLVKVLIGNLQRAEAPTFLLIAIAVIGMAAAAAWWLRRVAREMDA